MPLRRPPRLIARLLLVLTLAGLTLAVLACGGTARTAAQPTLAVPTAAPPVPTTAPPATATTRPAAAAATPATARPTGRPTATAQARGPQPPASMKTVRESQLPREARETLALIDKGGPFPYRQDGQTFQNRERLLPGKPEGYYREYTVDTPGSDDRGARRIIFGQGGEYYYTDDHYASFRWILRE